jgi:hypothetical protein
LSPSRFCKADPTKRSAEARQIHGAEQCRKTLKNINLAEQFLPFLLPAFIETAQKQECAEKDADFDADRVQRISTKIGKASGASCSGFNGMCSRHWAC